MDDLNDPCMVVKIRENSIGDGWIVVCCEEHDPLITTWDTAEAAKATLSKTLGIALDDWWFEDGRWMAETPAEVTP